VNVDREVLAAAFASRVRLAKRSREEAIADAIRELEVTVAWIKSPAKKEGSFLWYCDEFELDAASVRKAIQERKK